MPTLTDLQIEDLMAENDRLRDRLADAEARLDAAAAAVLRPAQTVQAA